MNIDMDEYIKASQSMIPIVSKNNNDVYDFKDIVLVKSYGFKKDGKVRKYQEHIKNTVNSKVTRGVNLLKQYAIKRVNDGNINYCYILMDKAKGKSFDNYTYYKDFKVTRKAYQQLENQQVLLDLDDRVYINLIFDVINTFNMDIDLSSDKIFLDVKNKYDAFTLVGYNGFENSTCNFYSLKDMIKLDKYLNTIFIDTLIKDDDKNSMDSQKDESNRLYYLLKGKLTKLCLDNIDNYKKVYRFILRTYSKKELDKLKEYKVYIEPLTMNKEEEEYFNRLANILCLKCIESIRKGELTYDTFLDKVMDKVIEEYGLNTNYRYSLDNKIKQKDYDTLEDYYKASDNSFRNEFLELFNEILKDEALKSYDDNLMKAYKESNTSSLEYRKIYNYKY